MYPDPPFISHPIVTSEPFKLECVVVCDGYSDILAHTLPDNRSLFDRIVVVTSPHDRETRRVCEYWHVECIPTDVIESRWEKFCKGKAINVGLRALGKEGWVLHLDADIALPPLSRQLIQGAQLDKSFLYGADRANCKSFEAWQEFRGHPRLQHENECWLHMDQFPFGVRVVIHGHGGYIPIGFFQLWYPSVSGIATYPEGHTTAAREDSAFALQWPRNRRALLPEIVAYHLESENAEMGTNWDGRKTRRFAPSATNLASQRKEPWWKRLWAWLQGEWEFLK